MKKYQKKLFFQFLGKKNKKKVENGDAVLETVSNVLTASFGVVNIDLSKIKNILNKIENAYCEAKRSGLRSKTAAFCF